VAIGSVFSSQGASWQSRANGIDQSSSREGLLKKSSSVELFMVDFPGSIS
jgi:hypothetical protein